MEFIQTHVPTIPDWEVLVDCERKGVLNGDGCILAQYDEVSRCLVRWREVIGYHVVIVPVRRPRDRPYPQKRGTLSAVSNTCYRKTARDEMPNAS